MVKFVTILCASIAFFSSGGGSLWKPSFRHLREKGSETLKLDSEESKQMDPTMLVVDNHVKPNASEVANLDEEDD